MSAGDGDYAILISLSMREEAEVVAAALRADGIDAFIGNSNHAYFDWGYTIALGGLQVFVPRAKLIEARQALRERIKGSSQAQEGEPVKRRDRWKLWLLVGWYVVPAALSILIWFGGIAFGLWTSAEWLGPGLYQDSLGGREPFDPDPYR